MPALPRPRLHMSPRWVLFTPAHANRFNGTRGSENEDHQITICALLHLSDCTCVRVRVCVWMFTMHTGTPHSQRLCWDANKQSYITGVRGYSTPLDKQTLDAPRWGETSPSPSLVEVLASDTSCNRSFVIFAALLLEKGQNCCTQGLTLHLPIWQKNFFLNNFTVLAGISTTRYRIRITKYRCSQTASKKQTKYI